MGKQSDLICEPKLIYMQVASTLLEAGVWRQGSHPASEKVLLDVLEESRTRTGGLVGFGEFFPGHYPKRN
jgi:hypothetical protein